MAEKTVKTPHKFCGKFSTMTTSTYSETVLTVLREQYAGRPNGAKILAQHARASYRTAENWLLGICAPHGDKLINIQAECEELRRKINELIDERQGRGK